METMVELWCILRHFVVKYYERKWGYLEYDFKS